MVIFLGIMCIRDTLVCFVEHIIDTGRIITTRLKIRRSCRFTKTETTVIADIGLAYLSILGCNQNNSISSTGTIYGSSRSILKTLMDSTSLGFTLFISPSIPSMIVRGAASALIELTPRILKLPPCPGRPN